MKTLTQQEFCDWLVNQAPMFDEHIMSEMRPKDGWTGVITHVEVRNFRWIEYEVELPGPPPIPERFKDAWPDMSFAWKQIGKSNRS